MKVKKYNLIVLSLNKVEATVISHHRQVIGVKVIKCQLDVDLTEFAEFGKIIFLISKCLGKFLRKFCDILITWQK